MAARSAASHSDRSSGIRTEHRLTPFPLTPAWHRERNTERLDNDVVGFQAPITVLLVEDSRASSRSLTALLNWQRDVHVTATATDGGEAVALAERLAPDVCLISASIGPAMALTITDRVTHIADPPRVLLYAHVVGINLTAAVMVAGARGIVSRSDDPARVADAIKRVAAGRLWFAELKPGAPRRLADLVADRDRAIVTMLLARSHPDEIAQTIGISARALRARRRQILQQLDDAILSDRPGPR
jgi:DNA-binding NarL/FixJ family response regulator